MSMEASDAMRRARFARRVGAIGTFAAATHSTQAAAHMVPALSIAGSMFLAAGGIAVVAETQGFPVELIWITGALTGTIAGAVAAVLVSLIVSARATPRHHLLRLALAFVGGLIIAPFAVAYAPHAATIPLAFHVFGISALCAFGAPALAIALHKRSESIAETVIDRVTTPQQARDSKKEDES